MYKLFRKILFLFPAETAHHLTFNMLKWVCFIPGIKSLIHVSCNPTKPEDAVDLFGLQFPNRVGLAAGLDKNAVLFEELAAFGFGFIEIGTITPRPQTGNPQPRLFRLLSDSAIINRMGFNNDGMEIAYQRLAKRKNKSLVIGGNIGKNKDTPNEHAWDDYRLCFEKLYPVVDYFVVNVSSPNTPGLRELQEKEPLTKLLTQLQALNQSKEKPKPVLLKIAPDLTHEQLDDIIEIVLKTSLSGVIATNTTISRAGLQADQQLLESIGAGGLSGKPLRQNSTDVIRYIVQHAKGKIPVIGVGGIMSAEDAIEKLEAGASLVQIYTGFVYEGPPLISSIIKAIRKVNK
jgi:dihydroorotate dehydrogenase